MNHREAMGRDRSLAKAQAKEFAASSIQLVAKRWLPSPTKTNKKSSPMPAKCMNWPENLCNLGHGPRLMVNGFCQTVPAEPLEPDS